MGGSTDLISAVGAGDAAAVERLLADDPSLVSAHDDAGVSALLLARYRSDRAVMDALLAVDPEMDVFEAAAYGHLDRLSQRIADDPGRAIAFGADGFTPLHLAAFFGKVEVARVLLGAGARVDVQGRNEFANQPLHAAAAGRHLEVCRVLLAAGADVHATQHGGFTPLHSAAQHGDDGLIELFLTAGADPTARDASGRTPADLAAAAGHEDVATRLRERAAPRDGQRT